MGYVDGKRDCKILLVRNEDDDRTLFAFESAPSGVVIVGGLFEGMTPSGEATIAVSDAVASGTDAERSFSVMKAEKKREDPRSLSQEAGPKVQAGTFPSPPPPSPPGYSKSVRSVAVPAFAWADGFEGESLKLTSLVISAIAASGKASIVPWSSIHEKARLDHFSGTPLSLSKWKSAGADSVLIGKVEPSPRGMSVEYRLIDTETGRDLAAGRASGPRELLKLAAERVSLSVVGGGPPKQEAKLVPSVVAVPVFIADGVDSKTASALSDALSDEFSATGYVRLLPFADHPHRIEPYHLRNGSVDYSLWAQAGADWLIIGKVSQASPGGLFAVNVDCVETVSGKTTARFKIESTLEEFGVQARSFVDSWMTEIASLARTRTEKSSSKKTGIASEWDADAGTKPLPGAVSSASASGEGK